MKSTSTFKIILATTVLSSTVATFAQPKPEGQRQQPAPRFTERPQPVVVRPGSGGGGVERVFAVLTEEQRYSMRQASEGQREKVRAIEEKIRDARKAILEASVAEKFDEDAVRNKAEEAAKLDAELTVMRAKALSLIKPPLSKEQIEKIKNPQPLEGTPGRGRDFRPGERTRPNPPQPGRDEHDLPPPPKPQ